MAEQKESSVLFSLKELMNLEEDRIKQEESEKEASARHQAEAKAATERATRDAEEARLRGAEEQRRLEEQQRREEEARLEALRHAEIEKARAEVEHRARMEALASQQAHEQELAKHKHGKDKKRLQITIAVVSAVLVIGAVTTAVLVTKHNTEQAQKAAQLEAQRLATQERYDKLKRDLENANKKETELRRTLANAKDEAERARIEAQLTKAKKEREQASRALGARGGSRAKTGGGSTKPCKCPPGDPLCSCL